MLYEEIDNKVWSGGENEITSWCKKNKVFDEITKEEIEKRLEEIFGIGSRQEIQKATTNEKIAERIEEMTKCEE